MHKLFEIPSITLFLCAFCAFLWLKSPFNQRNLRFKKYSSCLCGFVAKTPRNQRNPRLMNYLRAYKALYSRRGCSISIEDSLQIGPIMQNKPNFQKAQMNVSPVVTREYKNISNWTLGENKPNTNPIQTQNKAKTNPISEMPKMNVSSLLTKDYQNQPSGAFRKTNPIKPNFHAALNERQLLCRKAVMEIMLKTPKFGIIMMLSNTQSDFSYKILQRNHEFDSMEPMEAVCIAVIQGCLCLAGVLYEDR